MYVRVFIIFCLIFFFLHAFQHNIAKSIPACLHTTEGCENTNAGSFVKMVTYVVDEIYMRYASTAEQDTYWTYSDR